MRAPREALDTLKSDHSPAQNHRPKCPMWVAMRTLTSWWQRQSLQKTNLVSCLGGSCPWVASLGRLGSQLAICPLHRGLNGTFPAVCFDI